MHLIRGLSHLKRSDKGCVLTIGNFDGLHLGHQAVVQKLAECGRGLNLPGVGAIFEPQPLEYFLGDNAPSRLMRLREKAIEFAKLPVDELVVLSFNQELANCEAECFVEEVLAGKLKVRHLVIGDDFHFGKARRGNFAMLREKGKQFGFTVEDTGSFQLQDLRISSTIIRDLLGQGKLDEAAVLLGRPYSICGRVAHGDKRGRTIGYPTANLLLFRKNVPIEGVFAVTMTGVGEQAIKGVANVGTRPTVDGGAKVILEVHLFDFCREIYGHYVEVQFIEKIRGEVRFSSLEALRSQIIQDVAAAKKILRD